MTTTTSLERCSRCGSQYLFDLPDDRDHGTLLCPACQRADERRAADDRVNVRLRMTVGAALLERHRSIAWLATETGLSERVLRSRMAGTTSFGIAELGAVATALGCGWG
ncbi:MAG: hypothetical protein WAX29_03280, partial [Propionibacterium sp.]